MDGSVLGVERDVVPLGIRAVLSSGTGNALAAWRRAELCCIVRRDGRCPELGLAGVKRVRVRADVRAEERERALSRAGEWRRRERIPESAENDVRALWSGSLVLRVLLTPAQAHTTDFWYSARADY